MRKNFSCTISISLLQFRVKGKYGGQLRLKIGSPGIFPYELEGEFALFLKHCELLRIPRSKLRFKEDIRHHIEHNNLTFEKLSPDGPGNY